MCSQSSLHNSNISNISTSPVVQYYIKMYSGLRTPALLQLDSCLRRVPSISLNTSSLSQAGDDLQFEDKIVQNNR